MINPNKTIAAALIAISVCFGPGLSNAQEGTNSQAQVSGITAQNSVGNDAQALSGGNVFDFSNSNKPMGYAPSLPSFAGGPCMGVSGGVSASLPGFGIGGGRSFDDKSCQRRNWVQTLIGAAERMPETEANELKRVAIVVMMQDEILAPAFTELGYNVDAPGSEVSSAKPRQDKAGLSTATVNRGREIDASIGAMAPNCNVVVPEDASAAFIKLVEARGCAVRRN